MNPIAVAGAVGVGVAFGYAAQRGALCMNSGFRMAFQGDWTKVKAFALAVAVQLIALPAVFGAGLAQPAHLPLLPLAAVVGGVLFGVSMPWAGGCAAGVWYKLGAGDVGALIALLGMALGSTASESGPLAPIRRGLQEAVTPNAAVTASPLVSLLAGGLLLAALARARDGRAGAWSWRRTGLLVGLVATVAWPLSALAGRQFGLAVMPGTTSLVSAATGIPFPAWDTLLLGGILIGGWLAARRAGRFSLSAPPPLTLLKRFAGGMGLGLGASIAAGCTVGQGLTGLALLAPGSFGVMAAIFAGSGVATLATRWAAKTSATSGPSGAATRP